MTEGPTRKDLLDGLAITIAILSTIFVLVVGVVLIVQTIGGPSTAAIIAVVACFWAWWRVFDMKGWW